VILLPSRLTSEKVLLDRDLAPGCQDFPDHPAVLLSEEAKARVVGASLIA
jgi:hypothetical protein